LPRLEALEDRRLLSLFGNLYTDFTTVVGNATTGIMGQVNSKIFDFANVQNKQVLYSLPLIGQELDKLGNAQFLSDLETSWTNSNLGSLLNATTDTATALTDMQNFFTSAGLMNNNQHGSIVNEVKDNNGDLTDAEFEFVLQNTAFKFTAPLSSSLGLPNLGLTTSGSVQVTLAYTLDLRIGVDQTGVYLDTSAMNPKGQSWAEPHDLTVSLDVTIPGFSATGKLGPVHLNVYDQELPKSPMSPINWQTTSSPSPSDFNVTFDMDFSNAGKVYSQQLNNLVGTASTEAGAGANINLGLVLGVQDFVTVGTNFHLGWKFDGSLDADPPDIEFNDLQVDMGTFFSQWIDPVISKIQQVTKPLQPVVDVLEHPIPVLSDLSELAGGQAVTLESLIDSNMGNNSLETFDNAVKFINGFNIQGSGDTTIELGSFALTGDITKQSSLLSTLKDQISQTFDSVQQQLAKAGVDVQAFDNLEQQTQPDGKDPMFSFPIFDDPQQILNLFMDKPADLFDCHLVDNQDFPLGKFSKFYAIFGPIGVQISGSADLKANFDFGYDTYGFMNGLDPIEGFYVVSDASYGPNTVNDQAYLTLTGSLSAGPGINLVVASASITGGVEGTATLALNSPFNDNQQLGIPGIPTGVNMSGDGRIRFQDIKADIGSFGPVGFLQGHGEVDASLDFHVDVGFCPFCASYDKVLAKVVLLDFNFNTAQNVPILAGAGTAYNPDPKNTSVFLFNGGQGGQLILNMGPHAYERQYGDTSDGDEDFSVTFVKMDQNDPGETVEVSAFGIQQTYEGVTSILAEGGMGNNTITIDPEVKVPVRLFANVDSGGSGFLRDPEYAVWQFTQPREYYYYSESQFQHYRDVLQAGGGDATLVGGQGDDSYVAYYLDPTDKPPTEAVSAGDELIGGWGKNTIIGGNAQAGSRNDEMLVGGTAPSSRDTITAGSGGDNTLVAGPNGDALVGGQSSANQDTFVAGSGNDTMTGGAGSNLFEWHGPDPQGRNSDGNPTISGGPAGSTNTLEVLGLRAKDPFVAQAQGSGILVLAPGGHPIHATGIQTLTMDDGYGGSAYTVNHLDGTGIQQVNLNLSEVGNPAGSADPIVIDGSPTQVNTVVVSANPHVLAGQSYDSHGNPLPPVYGEATNIDLTIGALNPASTPPSHYVVTAAIPKPVDTLTINTGAADDTVSVESTQGSGILRQDGTMAPSGSVYVNTYGGDDVINVGTNKPGQGLGLLDRIQGNLYIDAGSGSQNQLNIDEGAAVNGDTLALTAMPPLQLQNPALYQLDRYSGEMLKVPEGGGGRQPAEPYRYSMLIQYVASSHGTFGAGVNLYLTRDSDTLYVTDTMSGAPTTVYTDGKGAVGDDKVIVGYNGVALTNPGTPRISTIAGILGPLNVEGTNGPIQNSQLGGADLQVFDEQPAAAEAYDVTASQVDRIGLTPIAYQVLGTSVDPGQLELWGAELGNNFAVEGTAAWTKTTVYAGNGNNTILVGRPIRLIIPPNINILEGYNLDAIQGPLTVIGGAGKNQMTVDDDFSPSHGYDLTASFLQRTGGMVVARIYFSGLTTLTLKEAAVADTATTVSGTPAGTNILVVPGSGHDSATLTALDQFKGAVTFQWQAGMKNVVVDDSSATQNAQYAINLGASSGVLWDDGATSATFNYQGTPADPLASLFLFAGLKHVDVINVLAITPGTLTELFGGTVTNSVTVGDTNLKDPAPDQLNVVQGALIVDGMGTTVVTLNDKLGPSHRPYTLGVATLQFSPSLPAIQFSGITTLILDAAPAATVDVIGLAPGRTAQLNLSGAGSKVVVGSAMKKLLGAIQGTVSVAGTGTDSIVIDDQNGPGMSAYDLTGTSVTDATAVIQYANVQSVLLEGASGPSQYFVQALAAKPLVTIQAQGNGNLLRGPNQNTVWALAGVNSGTLGSVHFSGIQTLTGGTAVNVFVFAAGASVSGKIDGGPGGDNWLDYAAYTTPVAVNLAAGTATGVGGGIAHVRNVRGGQDGNSLIGDSQGNVLIGGAGANKIFGGTNPSLLIGGKGPDTVFGGSGDDILIAGYTDYDASTLANDLALESILDEWLSANLYSVRIGHIKNGGGLNGSNKLIWGVTVHDNAVTNQNVLEGAGGGNWFFYNPSHTTTNRTTTEQMN
jgi:hypothetical protein